MENIHTCFVTKKDVELSSWNETHSREGRDRDRERERVCKMSGRFQMSRLFCCEGLMHVYLRLYSGYRNCCALRCSAEVIAVDTETAVAVIVKADSEAMGFTAQ